MKIAELPPGSRFRLACPDLQLSGLLLALSDGAATVKYDRVKVGDGDESVAVSDRSLTISLGTNVIPITEGVPGVE